MKVTPDDYGRRCQFDHFCKLVLYHEAVDYFRERKRQRGWETSFETLPLSDHGDRDGGSKCVMGCGQFLDLMSKYVRRKK